LHISNTIQRHIDLPVPISRVWSALTDYKKFSLWFGANLDGPFTIGKPSGGNVSCKGYEHIRFEAIPQKMEPETYFSYTWHPFPMDPNVDYSLEEPTLVEFRLESTETGTRLTVTESGFEKIPAHRREEAFRMNSAGWEGQMENILEYVTA